MGNSLTSETLFLPLVVAGVLAMVHYRRSRRLRWALAAGALAGLAALTRSNGVALLLPLLVGAWTVRPLSARTLATGIGMLAAAVLVISPWTIRNALALDAFVPVTTQAGYGLAGQYSDTSRDDQIYPSAWRPPQAHGPYRAIIEDPRLDEAQVDKRLRSESRGFIRAHPEYVAQTGFRNALRLLGLRDVGFERLAAKDYGMSPALSKASIYSFYVVALLALVGLSHPAVRRTPAFVWLTPVVMILTTVFIAAGIRYRVPADPFVVCLAAVGLVQAFSWMSSRRGRTHPRTPMRSG
jgi:4-amino-4-deoxy-L-arabinose transferase-like glycosyltransferase